MEAFLLVNEKIGNQQKRYKYLGSHGGASFWCQDGTEKTAEWDRTIQLDFATICCILLAFS